MFIEKKEFYVIISVDKNFLKNQNNLNFFVFRKITVPKSNGNYVFKINEFFICLSHFLCISLLEFLLL